MKNFVPFLVSFLLFAVLAVCVNFRLLELTHSIIYGEYTIKFPPIGFYLAKRNLAPVMSVSPFGLGSRNKKRNQRKRNIEFLHIFTSTRCFKKIPNS